jgi:hypothetical protein
MVCFSLTFADSMKLAKINFCLRIGYTTYSSIEGQILSPPTNNNNNIIIISPLAIVFMSLPSMPAAMAPESPQQRKCSAEWCTNIIPPNLYSSTNLSEEIRSKLYVPLHKAEKEIRLLEIQPGGLDDPIQCKMFRSPLFRSPRPYSASEVDGSRLKVGVTRPEIPLNRGRIHFLPDRFTQLVRKQFVWRALSYTWGNSAEPEKIVVNGHKISVRCNLFESLKWLRYHGYHEPIWIDALCIDQTNLSEKEAQVQLMGKIYNLAREILIYIPTHPENKIAPEIIEQEIETSDIFKDQTTLEEGVKQWFRDISQSYVLDMLATMVRYDSPNCYWMRMWTVQECALAYNITVTSGALRLSWHRVMDFITVLGLLLNEALRNNNNEDAARLHPLICFGARQRGDFRGERKKDTLLHTLVKLQDEHCGDPRDKIYGAVGLLEDYTLRDKVDRLSGTWSRSMGFVDTINPLDKPYIRADYTLCTSCVWRNATIQAMIQTYSLDVLCYSGSFHAGEFSSDQSWVPNWFHLPPAANLWKKYQAFPRCQTRIEFPGNFFLKVKGFVLGHPTPQSLFIRYNKMEGRLSDYEGVLQMFAEVRRFIYDVFADDSYRRQYLREFVRLIVEIEPVDYSYLAQLENLFIENCSINDIPSGDLKGALPRLANTFVNCRLLLINTSSGQPLIGLTNVGDDFEAEGYAICAVVACNTLLVIRHAEGGYEIRGQCVVAGYGSGKALAELDAHKWELESFCFR